MIRRLALVVVLAACSHGLEPSTALDIPMRTDGALIVGELFSVEGFWSATCTKMNWHKEDDVVSCHFQPVRLDVTCSLPCKIEPWETSDSETFRHQKVIPLGEGPYAVEATTTRVETGQKDVRKWTVDVARPDRVELHCLLDPTQSEAHYAPCDRDGVPAAQPLVVAEATRAGTKHTSMLLEINGVVVGNAPVSLATLFPQSRAGEGVVPGTYTIDVALAGVTSRYKVVAR